MAYLPHPRWKALTLALPFPFTTIALGQGQPINATHVLALLVLIAYYHAIRLLHHRLSIVPSIGLGLGLYVLSSHMLLSIVPIQPASFPICIGIIGLLAIALFVWQPPRSEPHHRTPLPVYLKLPTVIAVVGLLIYLKSSLQGFATLFPLVGVVGLYEARKSLWSVCRQAPIFTLGMCALLTAAYTTQTLLGLTAALSIGWGMYLIIILPLTLRMWRREDANGATAGNL
ncbi:MAG: hypothetical protein CME28_09010 [Gemmatimonadetes bacterium]|nr:hypothetical protein [Gemmatimonadota bacterium]